MYSTVTTKETVRGLKAASGFLSVNHETQNRINRLHTYETFDVNPTVSKLAGGAAAGATGEVDIMSFGPNTFEYCVLGAGQTLLAPVLTATGLDVSMDLTADEGIEMTQGILSKSRHSFIVGTNGPFFFRLKFKIADVSGTDDCAVGFRKAAAYTAAIDNYTDFAVLNVISGDIKIETALNNAATTTTDTTDNWADAATHTLQVDVSAAGVVTYKIDGVAPTATAAFTFDSADVVIPFFYFLHDATAPGVIELIEWECGLGT